LECAAFEGSVMSFGETLGVGGGVDWAGWEMVLRKLGRMGGGCEWLVRMLAGQEVRS
jgi:hypothetical protein